MVLEEQLQGIVILTSTNNSFAEKELYVRSGQNIKIGRKVSNKTVPERNNGYFDAKVLSRTHAELSFAKNTVWIQDLKSSNGTFVNGERLCEEGVLSPLVALKTGDLLEFGVEIKDSDGKMLYNKISAKIVVNYEKVSLPNAQPVGTRDTEELLAMIRDEKALSLEASEALSRIRASFDFIEKNSDADITHLKADQEDFKTHVGEISERLKSLTKLVEQHKEELKSYEMKFEKHSSLNSNFAVLEASVSDVMLTVKTLETATERQLTIFEERAMDNITLVEEKLSRRLSALKEQLNESKELFLIEKNENAAVNDKLVELFAKFDLQNTLITQLKEEQNGFKDSINNYENTIAELKKQISHGAGPTPRNIKLVTERPATGYSKSGNIIYVIAVALIFGVGTAYILSPTGISHISQYAKLFRSEFYDPIMAKLAN